MPLLQSSSVNQLSHFRSHHDEVLAGFTSSPTLELPLRLKVDLFTCNLVGLCWRFHELVRISRLYDLCSPRFLAIVSQSRLVFLVYMCSCNLNRKRGPFKPICELTDSFILASNRGCCSVRQDETPVRETVDAICTTLVRAITSLVNLSGSSEEVRLFFSPCSHAAEFMNHECLIDVKRARRCCSVEMTGQELESPIRSDQVPLVVG